MNRIMKLIIAVIAAGLIGVVYFMPITSPLIEGSEGLKGFDYYKSLIESCKFFFQNGGDGYDKYIIIATIGICGLMLAFALLTFAFIVIKNFFGILVSKKTKAPRDAFAAVILIAIALAPYHYFHFIAKDAIPEGALSNMYLGAMMYPFSNTIYYLVGGAIGIIVLGFVANSFVKNKD